MAFAVTRRVTPQEVMRQREDVVAAFTQGRQVELHNAQPVVEVGAETTLAHEFFERSVRGRNDAHVDMLFANTSEAPNDFLFEKLEQLGLQSDIHVAAWLRA